MASDRRPIDPATLVIETPRTVLALPGRDAVARVLAYHLENRAHLEPWEPPLPADFYTAGYMEARLERHRVEAAEDKSLRLYVFDRAAGVRGPVLGNCALTGIIRGPLQACALGYSIAAAAQGSGLATEVVAAALDVAWDRLRLHRVEASYAPANLRSGRLLRRLGFTIEGTAREYLHIGGAWQDMVRAAIVSPRFSEAWDGE